MSTTRARRLRRTMTDCERKLWFALRGRRLAYAKFRRQVPLGPHVADFLSKRHRLVVEVDGGQHGGEQGAARDRYLEEMGYRTLRVWNADVVTNLEGVLETIATALKEQAQLHGPDPERPPHPPKADASGPSLSPLGRGAVRTNAPLHRRIDSLLPAGGKEGPAAKPREDEGRGTNKRTQP